MLIANRGDDEPHLQATGVEGAAGGEDPIALRRGLVVAPAALCRLHDRCIESMDILKSRDIDHRRAHWRAGVAKHSWQWAVRGVNC